LNYFFIFSLSELDKRLETDFGGSGEVIPESGTTATPTVEVTVEEVIHPDLIETVVFCKNIRNVQVLSDAIKGFQGMDYYQIINSIESKIKYFSQFNSRP
jgi:hypothetical protein